MQIDINWHVRSDSSISGLKMDYNSLDIADSKDIVY